MNFLAPKYRKTRRGFNLIEMMVVLVLISIAILLALPALKGFQRSLILTKAGSQVKECLGLARQSAVARNRPVEVRIYLSGENGTEEDAISLYQKKDTASNYVLIGKKQFLDRGAILSPHADWSSILDASTSETDSQGKYRSFRFMGDGSVELATADSPTLTILGHADADKTQLPSNFFTLQLDPQSGFVRSFRP